MLRFLIQNGYGMMIIITIIVILLIRKRTARKKQSYLRGKVSQPKKRENSPKFTFDTICKRIKTLAIYTAVIGTLMAWIFSVVQLVNIIMDKTSRDGLWIVFAVAIFVPMVLWLTGWCLYAFIQLVEDTHAIRNKICPEETPHSSRCGGPVEDDDDVDDDFIEVVCPDCGEKWSAFFDETEVFCHKCKKNISVR